MAAGTKHDGGKPRPSLVLNTMSRAIQAVVDVAEHGARKYSPDNWLTVPNALHRYTDAMLRHLLAEQAGEAKDGDSGLLHAAHAAWGALARLDLMIRKQEQDAVHIAGRVTAPAHVVDAMRYTFGADLGETAAELRAKRDAAEHQAVKACAAGLLNTALKAQAPQPALKLDPALQWSEQLVRWLRHYSFTFSRYEAEGLLRAEYASNTESLRVVGVAKRRYDGILAVIHDLPRDGTAVGGVGALGRAVDRAVAHWDELAKKSKTKFGGIDWAERVARRIDEAQAREPTRGTFSQWAQQVEAKIVNRDPSIGEELFDKLRAISPLFTRLEAQRQLIATYDCNTSRLAIKGVEGGQYEGFDVGMRNVNPIAPNFDASMRNLARTFGYELYKVDQRRVDQAQRGAEQAERERREKAQQEQALLRRHHLAATNPLRICRAKLKYLLSSASLPVTRRLEQLRRADRLRVELQGGELRMLVCDPNGAALVCLNQVIELRCTRLHALEDATVAAFNRVLAVPRLESLITPVSSKR